MQVFSNESKSRIFYGNAVSGNERTGVESETAWLNFSTLFFLRIQFLYLKIDKGEKGFWGRSKPFFTNICILSTQAERLV